MNALQYKTVPRNSSSITQIVLKIQRVCTHTHTDTQTHTHKGLDFFLASVLLKKALQQWTGGVAQAVEHLLCKPEALSSNSCSTKKENEPL
jgi:hypothetical protein